MPVFRVEDLNDTRLDPYRTLKRVNLTRWNRYFIAEGHRVVRRLLASRFQVESVIVSDRRAHTIADDVPPAVDLLVLPQALAEQLLGYNFHAGVMACGLREPSPDWWTTLPESAPRLSVVACPRLTDPDNLGALIRLCTGFGVDALLLGRGCADPFSRRVLRVSMGNAFELPIIETEDIESLLDDLRNERSVRLLAAVLSDEALPLAQVVCPDRMVLLLGNEAEGLDAAWIARADHCVTIPMHGGTDSLNVAVAAGIMLYVLTNPTRSLPR